MIGISLSGKMPDSLRELIKTANDNSIIIKYIDELSQLTQYAVEGRYDIICDDINDAPLYIDLIETFIEFTKKEIKKC